MNGFNRIFLHNVKSSQHEKVALISAIRIKMAGLVGWDVSCVVGWDVDGFHGYGVFGVVQTYDTDQVNSDFIIN